jgi:hypothetical protein
VTAVPVPPGTPGEATNEQRAAEVVREKELNRLLATAPAIDPNAEPPSLEELLAGTEFEGALDEITSIPDEKGPTT